MEVKCNRTAFYGNSPTILSFWILFTVGFTELQETRLSNAIILLSSLLSQCIVQNVHEV